MRMSSRTQRPSSWVETRVRNQPYRLFFCADVLEDRLRIAEARVDVAKAPINKSGVEPPISIARAMTMHLGVRFTAGAHAGTES